MKTNHTPGPWTVNSCGFIGTAQKSENDTSWTLIACPPYFHDETKYVKMPSTDTQAANARLIAAAPDLLAVCLKIANDPYTTCQCAEVVRQAIAKATGN